MKSYLVAGLCWAALGLSASAATPPPFPAKAPLSPAMQALVDYFRGTPSDPVEPFKIVGNVYYVGAKGIASYLISTPQGLIMIDTGTVRMSQGILNNIRKLGFEPKNVKYLLASHAHFDHIEGHAAMVRATGAKVVALGEDAKALATGTDRSAASIVGFEPVKVARVIKDGDTVELGGVTLKAMNLPGHTQGATSWFMTATEGGRSYSVMFFVSLTPNPFADIMHNPHHPDVIEDTARSILRVHKIPKPDIVLVGHPGPDFFAKGQRVRTGEQPSPMVTTDAEWIQMIKSEGFYKQLYSQSHGKPPEEAR